MEHNKEPEGMTILTVGEPAIKVGAASRSTTDLLAKANAEPDPGIIRRSVAVRIKSVDVEARTLTAVASSEAADWYGDVVMAKGWDLARFLKNPVIPWAHDYREPPVAKAIKVWVESDALMVTMQFATAEEYEFADTIFKLYVGGYLSAFSVGFKPLELERLYEDDRYVGTRFVRQELSEISCVVVPANPEALVAAAEKGVITGAERDVVMKSLEPAAPALEPVLEQFSGPGLGDLLDELKGLRADLNTAAENTERLDSISETLDALDGEVRAMKSSQPAPGEPAGDQPELDPEILSRAVAEALGGKIKSIVQSEIKKVTGRLD